MPGHGNGMRVAVVGFRESAVSMNHVAGQTGYVIEQVKGTHSVHMNS